MPSSDDITAVAGNANDMTLFEDETFDLVLSNATLEHDKHFWLSLAEVRRVLAPGGMLVIGAPGFRKNPERDHGRSTHTYRVHYRFDYYRFSDQAFREVFFEGMEDVHVQSVLEPPRFIGHGFKPGRGRSAIHRRSAARAPTGAPTVAVPLPAARRGLVPLYPRRPLRRLLSRLRARRA